MRPRPGTARSARLSVVSTGAMHTAILVCDGLNAIQVFLDGTLVAESYTVPGSVRSVGSLGIAVGHWPNPPATYTFQGTIYEFVLLKYDPQQDLLNLLDACCVDWRKLLIFVRELADRGISPAQLDAESGTGPILLNWAAPPTSERSSTGRGI